MSLFLKISWFFEPQATTNRQKTKNGQLNNHNVAKVGDTEASVESKKSSDGASGTNDIADGTKPTVSCNGRVQDHDVLYFYHNYKMFKFN